MRDFGGVHKFSLLSFQNTISPNWRENGNEKWTKIFGQNCPHFLFTSFFWLPQLDCKCGLSTIFFSFFFFFGFKWIFFLKKKWWCANPWYTMVPYILFFFLTFFLFNFLNLFLIFYWPWIFLFNKLWVITFFFLLVVWLFFFFNWALFSIRTYE